MPKHHKKENQNNTKSSASSSNAQQNIVNMNPFYWRALQWCFSAKGICSILLSSALPVAYFANRERKASSNTLAPTNSGSVRSLSNVKFFEVGTIGVSNELVEPMNSIFNTDPQQPPNKGQKKTVDMDALYRQVNKVIEQISSFPRNEAVLPSAARRQAMARIIEEMEILDSYEGGVNAVFLRFLEYVQNKHPGAISDVITVILTEDKGFPNKYFERFCRTKPDVLQNYLSFGLINPLEHTQSLERFRFLLSLKNREGKQIFSMEDLGHENDEYGNSIAQGMAYWENYANLDNLVQATLELGEKIDFNHHEKNHSATILHTLIEARIPFAIIKRFLKISGSHALFNAVDNQGRTPTMLATFFGRYDVLQLLAKKGASLFGKDNAGNTILHIAMADPEEINNAFDAIGIDARRSKTASRNHLGVGSGAFLLPREAQKIVAQPILTTKHLGAMRRNENPLILLPLAHNSLKHVFDKIDLRSHHVSAAEVQRLKDEVAALSPLSVLDDCFEKRWEVVKYLVSKGLDLDTPNAQGETPRQLFIQNSYFKQKAKDEAKRLGEPVGRVRKRWLQELDDLSPVKPDKIHNIKVS